MRAFLVWILFAALLVTLPAEQAEARAKITKNEWRLLPSFCMYTQTAPGWGTETQRRLHATNNDWIHVHHYCWAIVWTMRSYQPGMSQREARHYLWTAIDDLSYTINNTTPGFLLRPDMFVRKATLHARLGNYTPAAAAARDLIAERPELPEGYIALADVQIKAGHPEQARKTLVLAKEKVQDQARLEAMKNLLPPH